MVKMNLLSLGIILLITLLTGCVQQTDWRNMHSAYRFHGQTYHVLSSAKNYEETGTASWYGKHFNHRRTSSGERYNMYKLTAAHKTLPLHSYVLVTNLQNGKKVTVRVNDRGPFTANRVIDLSYAAAKKIGIIHSGTAKVNVKIVAHA